ncbi:MAG: Tex-like N-terminal domain-containing protein, partial [Bacilli bacterium]
MNEQIIKQISFDLKINDNQTKETLKLLESGNTIPFIARYRKEATGNLDEEQIRKISEVYLYQVNLLKRKEDVIRLITEKELMTEELNKQIMQCLKLIEVEDLYRPFKEKKQTKATKAIKNGLEPLAKLFLTFPKEEITDLVKPYLNEEIKTNEDALINTGYIIAEMISDNANYRKWIRANTYIYGNIKSTKKKNSHDENLIYEMYYDYEEPLKRIKPHRILALNRGEKEKILNISIEYAKEKVYDYLEKKIIKNYKVAVTQIIIDAIKDSYKRLIKPSIEREIRSELTTSASITAIDNFS